LLRADHEVREDQQYRDHQITLHGRRL
jgi:hypothetical protein